MPDAQTTETAHQLTNLLQGNGCIEITEVGVSYIIKALTEAEHAGFTRAISAASTKFPTTWLDNLLTGQDGIGNPPYDCRHIEKLIRDLKASIRKLQPGE